MNIISEKLDIFNIFRNMCIIENINNNSKYDSGIIQMSEECTNSLSQFIIYKNYNIYKCRNIIIKI